MDEIYKSVFHVCAIWDTYKYQWLNYCGFNIEPYYSDMCVYRRCPQTLAEICSNIGICCGFRAVAAREKYPGLIALRLWLIYLSIYVLNDKIHMSSALCNSYIYNRVCLCES